MSGVNNNQDNASSVKSTGAYAMWKNGKFSVDRSKLNSSDIGWFKRWLLNLKIRNVERMVNSSDVNADSAFCGTIVKETDVAIREFCGSPVIKNPWTIFGAIRYANTLFEKTESTIRKKQTQFGENAQKFFETYQNLPNEVKSNLPVELRNILRNNGKGLLSNDQLEKAEKVVATMQGILENKWRRHSKAGNSWLQQVQLTRCLNRSECDIYNFTQGEAIKVESNLITALNESAVNKIFYEEVEKKDTTVSSTGIGKKKIQLDQKSEIKFVEELKFYFGEPYLAINIGKDDQQKTVYVKLEDTFCGIERQNEKDVIIFSIPLMRDEKFDVLTSEGKQIEYLTYTIPASNELKNSLVKTNLLDLSQDDLHQNTLSKFKVKLDDAVAIGDPQKQNGTTLIYAPDPNVKQDTNSRYNYHAFESLWTQEKAYPSSDLAEFYVPSKDSKYVLKFSLRKSIHGDDSIYKVWLMSVDNKGQHFVGDITEAKMVEDTSGRQGDGDTITFQCKYLSKDQEHTEEITVKKESLLQCQKGKKDAADNPPLDVYLTRNGWFPAKDEDLIFKSADGKTQIKIINFVLNPVHVADSKIDWKSSDFYLECRYFTAYNVIVSNVENNGKQVQLSFKPELNDRGKKIHPDQEEQNIIFDISELEKAGKSDKS